MKHLSGLKISVISPLELHVIHYGLSLERSPYYCAGKYGYKSEDSARCVAHTWSEQDMGFKK